MLAIARDYDQLIAAFRARRDELKVTHLTLDDIAGLQGGYTGKLLSDPPIRAFGRVSLGPILGALGLAVVLVQDNAALRRVQDRLVTRKHRKMHADRSQSWFTSKNAREMARRRAMKMSEKERSASASKAAKPLAKAAADRDQAGAVICQRLDLATVTPRFPESLG